MWITLNTLYAKISKHRYNYSTDMKMVIYSSHSLLESKSVYFPTRSNHSLCQTAHPGYFLHEAVLSVSSVEYLEAVRWPINSLFFIFAQMFQNRPWAKSNIHNSRELFCIHLGPGNGKWRTSHSLWLYPELKQRASSPKLRSHIPLSS